MNRLFYKHDRKLPAFTIVESMISLVTVSMGIILISLVIRTVWSQQQAESELTNFHLYLRTVESPKYHFQYVDHNAHQLKLISNDKIYLIDLTSTGIRMTTDKGGYVPLFDQVERVKWQYEHSVLTTQVQMKNGNTFKAVSLIEPERNRK